ncbi:MAG: hypothetical protein AB1345_00545 [Chloroflexota bacterium]
MKHSKTIFVLLITAVLLTACGSGVTLTTSKNPPPLPTAVVPPLEDIDNAIQQWESSNITRYSIEVEERTTANFLKVRLVVVDDQIRVAQVLYKDEEGSWKNPQTMDIMVAQAYTVDALFERFRRDTLGLGPAPVNLHIYFNPYWGYPSIAQADALPTYNEEGKEVLNRAYSYSIVVQVNPLLEDTFGKDRQPTLTLIRSGGPEAWCDNLRIYSDGSSIYTDECSQTLLQRKLPDDQLLKFQNLIASFGSLDDLRAEGNQSQQLIIIGNGSGTPDANTLEAAWLLTSEFHDLLSQPFGAGVMLVYSLGNHIYNIDLLSMQSQSAELSIQGSLNGALLSPLGTLLVYSDDMGLHRIDIQTGVEELLISSTEGTYYRPLTWSQDDRLLVVRTQSGAEDIGWIWVTSGEKSWHELPLPAGYSNYGCSTGWAWSPEDALLAFTGLGYGDGCNQVPGLTLIDLELNVAQNLALCPEITTGLEDGSTIMAGAHTPAWSPDGMWLALGLDIPATEALVFPTQLVMVHPDGRNITYVTNNTVGIADHPTWSAGGLLYYSLTGVSEAEDGVYRYFPTAGETTRIISGSALHPLSISPDSEYLVYENESGLSVWSFTLGQSLPVATNQEEARTHFLGWIYEEEQ